MRREGRDLTGERFGRLEVIRREIVDAPPRRRWLVRCDCGQERTVQRGHLEAGNTKSCGCLNREKSAGRFYRHGLSYRRERHSWLNMLARCTNPNHNRWPSYGGRGIAVCERWASLLAFVEDMGPCPEGMSLDRIDVNGNYEPANCRWATTATQARNRTNNRLVTADGETMLLLDYATKHGLPYAALYAHHANLGLNPAPVEALISRLRRKTDAGPCGS